MQIGGEDYYRGSLERMADAQLLLRNGEGSYSLAMYAAGLAVECMCRAFIWRVNGEFDGRHDLQKLIKQSQLLQRREAVLRQSGAREETVSRAGLLLKAATNTISRLWSNQYRFANESKVRAELKARGAYTGIKGDVLKANCAKIIAAALEIVQTGEVLWTLSKK
jgi:hypothetical protein